MVMEIVMGLMVAQRRRPGRRRLNPICQCSLISQPVRRKCTSPPPYSSLEWSTLEIRNDLSVRAYASICHAKRKVFPSFPSPSEKPSWGIPPPPPLHVLHLRHQHDSLSRSGEDPLAWTWPPWHLLQVHLIDAGTCRKDVGLRLRHSISPGLSLQRLAAFLDFHLISSIFILFPTQVCDRPYHRHHGGRQGDELRASAQRTLDATHSAALPKLTISYTEHQLAMVERPMPPTQCLSLHRPILVCLLPWLRCLALERPASHGPVEHLLWRPVRQHPGPYLSISVLASHRHTIHCFLHQRSMGPEGLLGNRVSAAPARSFHQRLRNKSRNVHRR